MNKLFIAICTWAALFGIISAQTPPVIAGLPPGPLIISQMPDFSKWTIDYTFTDAPKTGEDSPELAQYKKLAVQDPSVAKLLTNPHFLYSLNPARPVHVAITQTGEVRHEERDLERGLKSELWSNAGIAVERKPDTPELVIRMGDSKAEKEFPEFNWISKEGFTGIETQNGRKYLVFKQQVDPVSISYPGRVGVGTTVPAIAYIDLETRYPLSLQFGVETRQYTILPAPTAKLVMPDDFAAAAKATKDRVQQAIPHLSPP